MSASINKVPEAVFKNVIFTCLSGKDLALSVKRINKQWKKLVESSDPLVARLLEAERSRRYMSMSDTRCFSIPRDDDGWSTY